MDERIVIDFRTDENETNDAWYEGHKEFMEALRTLLSAHRPHIQSSTVEHKTL